MLNKSFTPHELLLIQVFDHSNGKEIRTTGIPSPGKPKKIASVIPDPYPLKHTCSQPPYLPLSFHMITLFQARVSSSNEK